MTTDAREQGRDFCRILVITEEAKETTTNVQLGSSNLEGPNCEDGSLISNKTVNPFPPFVVTVDMESGGTDVSRNNQNNRAEIALSSKPLRRQNNVRIQRGPIQPLVNHMLMLLKFDTKEEKPQVERGYDGADIRWRRCKRLSLFDSRQVVVLFSILSSVGTLVLIYLTMRIRQIGQNSVYKSV